MTPESLRTYRLSTGRNLRQFGDYLGVTGAAVCQWENNQARIPKSIIKLIDALQRLEFKKPGTAKHSEGYVLILAPNHPSANQTGYVSEHVLVCEKVLGKPLPFNAITHHIDGKKDNNKNSNLVICQDLDYHNLLHRRERALKECGHASWRKCVYCQEYDSLNNMVERKAHRYSQAHHKKCRSEYEKFRRAIRKIRGEYRAFISGHNLTCKKVPK